MGLSGDLTNALPALFLCPLADGRMCHPVPLGQEDDRVLEVEATHLHDPGDSVPGFVAGITDVEGVVALMSDDRKGRPVVVDHGFL